MHELENIKMTSPNLIPCIYNIYLFIYYFLLILITLIDAERLFEIFDKDGMKALTLRQFVRGLAIACRGSVHDKQLLSFQVYDYNNDGSISKFEFFFRKKLKKIYINVYCFRRNLITVLKLAWQK